MEQRRDENKIKLNKHVDVKTASNIEKCIFNSTINTCKDKNINTSYEDSLFYHVYNIKFNNIYENINTVVNYMKNNSYNYEELEMISRENLFPNIWIPGENTDEYIQTEDGIFECKNCGSKKTTYYSLQTRSADEPMTNFITCIQCNNRWKM